MAKVALLVLALVAIAHAAPRYEDLEAVAEAYFQRMQAQEKSYLEGKGASSMENDYSDIEDRLQKIKQKINQLLRSDGSLEEKEKEVIMEIDKLLRMIADKKGISKVNVSFPAPSNSDEQEKLMLALKAFKEQEEMNGPPDDIDAKIKEADRLLQVIAKARGLDGLKIDVDPEQ